MSDEQNDVVAEVPADAGTAEPLAPEVVAETTPPVVNPQDSAVIEEQRAEAQALAALAVQAPTPVLVAVPSSQNETQQPESAPEVEKETLPLNEVVSVLLVYVKAHRTAGDADLEAAVAGVEASLAAQA